MLLRDLREKWSGFRHTLSATAFGLDAVSENRSPEPVVHGTNFVRLVGSDTLEKLSDFFAHGLVLVWVTGYLVCVFRSWPVVFKRTWYVKAEDSAKHLARFLHQMVVCAEAGSVRS